MGQFYNVEFMLTLSFSIKFRNIDGITMRLYRKSAFDQKHHKISIQSSFIFERSIKRGSNPKIKKNFKYPIKKICMHFFIIIKQTIFWGSALEEIKFQNNFSCKLFKYYFIHFISYFSAK